jgi:uncharacterized membrane protein YfcA
LRGTSLEFLTPPLVAASAASAILLSIGSMIGALAWFRAREWRKLLLLGLPLAYFLLVGSGHEAWARFRVPLEPLMVIFAAVGALYIYRAIRVS